MSYSNYQLNQRINNLQNQINNIGGTLDLQDVCDNGHTTNTFLELISNPVSNHHITMNYSGVQVQSDGSQNATHQSDGLVILEPSTGDIGQLLKDNLKFTKGGYLTEITNTGSTLDINGQVSFNNPPHSVEPLNGNDLCTKGYVDSLVGQYSGGYNLFFNYSVTDGIYKSLGQSVVAAAQQIVPITTDTTNQLVASFVSPALGITSIPSGIWNVLLFSEVSAVGGVLTYYFEVLKLTGVTETLIFTSGLSTDVNATTTPTAYPINGTLTAPYTLLLTDKIVIKIYLHKDGTPFLVNTYFQNVYYSFTQTTLNAGTTLLSSNNTFTGINKYTLGIKTNGVDTDTAGALDIGTITATSINIGSASSTLTTYGINNFNGSINVPTAVFPNSTSIAVNGAYLTTNYVPNSTNTTITGLKTFSNTRTDFNLLSLNGNQLNVLNPSNTLYLGYTSTAGIINIGELQTSGEIKIGNNSRSGDINIGCGLLVTGNINVGVSTGISSIGIGSVSKAVTINGSTIGFNVFPTCSGTDPISTTSDNTLCTTNFVQSVINYLKTSAAANNWTNVNNFSTIQCDNFNASLISSTCEIAQILTTGTLNICKNLTSSGAINIGGNVTPVRVSNLSIIGGQINSNDTGTGNLNIGNFQTSGILQIGNNPNRLLASVISIGSGSASLSPINIGANTGATTIAIGNAAKTVTILGNTATSAITTGTLTVNAVNLQTTFTAPTLNQLGYTVRSTLLANQLLSVSPTNQNVLSLSLGIGIWNCNYALRLISVGGATTFTYMETFMQTSVYTAGEPPSYARSSDNKTNTVANNAATNVYLSGSSVIVCSVASTIQLFFSGTYTTIGTPQINGSAIPSPTYLSATRIA